MVTVKWTPDTTITEVELIRQARAGAITEMTIEPRARHRAAAADASQEADLA